MANITNLKRKAQKLVQQGKYAEAIELYIDIVSNGDSDPYDYVVLGDLLLRDDQTEIAVERYQEAVDAYVTGGLHRNAIALCKRIRRLTPDRVNVQRQLGDLYLKEGLNTEAALHFLEYLESAKQEEDFAEAAEDVCRTLLGFRLPSYDLVRRVVDIAREAERADDLAPLVFQQFQWAQQDGHSKVAGTLLETAQALDPDIESKSQPTAGTDQPVGIEETTLRPRHETADIDLPDPSAVNLEAPNLDDALNGAEPEPEPEPEPHTASGEISLDDLELSSGTPEAEPQPELEMVPREVPAGARPDESGVFDLDEAMNAEIGGEEAVEAVQGDSEPEASDQAADLRSRADRSLERGEQVLAQREYMRAGQAYLDQGEYEQAEAVFAQVVKLDPNHLEALEALVSVAKTRGDVEAQIRYACDLGDVFLAREMYAKALVRFELVLELDPDHPKAQSRVERLKAIDSETASQEGGEPQLTVRDEAGQPTQTENDLAAILDEFRASIVEAIPDDDAQSHYDMGMAYREMQLFDEAIQEFQISMTDEDIRPRALEMTADCHLSKGEFVEAHDLLEEVLAYAEETAAQARIHLAMGRCFVGYGQVDDAREAFHKALELNEELVEAAEQLQDLELRQSGE